VLLVVPFVQIRLRAVLRTGCDIVEIDRRILSEVFNIVDPPAGSFLDRTAGFVILLTPLFTAESLRGSGRAEVRTAITAARAGRWTTGTAAGTWREPARARAAEAAAPHRARTTKATTWARTAEPTRPRTRRAIFAGPCLADSQIAALEGLRIELLDDIFGDGAVGKLDKRKAARTSGLAIDRHNDVGRLCDGGKV